MVPDPYDEKDSTPSWDNLTLYRELMVYEDRTLDMKKPIQPETCLYQRRDW